MMPSLSPDTLPDLQISDLTFDSKTWDRRRSSHTKQLSVTCLENAANHLIDDQMEESRVFWPGAVEAVQMLREAIVEIELEKKLDERAARVVASWLPKYTLTRNARAGKSDA